LINNKLKAFVTASQQVDSVRLKEHKKMTSKPLVFHN